MIIEKIVIKNWLAFRGEHLLSPIPSGAISVVARYDSNPRRSNWAGKTAFLEAIEWALFGVHRKRYEDEVIHTGENEVSVHLVFSDGFEVKRERKRGKSTSFSVGVVRDGTTEWSHKKVAEKLVSDRLGFDAEDFRSTVCFSQGDTEAIVGRTSGERRKVISQWLELDAWTRVSARARAHFKQLTDYYQERRSNISNLEEQLETSILELASDETIQGWLYEGDEASKIHAKEWIDSKTAEFPPTNIDCLNASLEEVESRIEELESKLEQFAGIESAESDHRLREELIEQGKVLKVELTNSKVEGLQEAIDAFESMLVHVGTIKSESAESESLLVFGFDGMCPVTRLECSVSDEVRSYRQAISDRFRAAQDKMNEARDELEKKRSICNVLVRKQREVETNRTRFKAIVEEVKRLGPSSQKWINSDKPSIAEIQILKSKKIELRKQSDDLKSRIYLINERIAESCVIREKLHRLRDSFGELETQIKIASLVVKAASQTGIPAYIAEGLLTRLEERANGLLQGSGLSFTFSLDRETKDLTPTCFDCGYVYKGRKDKTCPACHSERGMKRSDDIEIIVDDGSGILEDVKTKSGGARVLIGSSIRLAAGLMLREMRGSLCSFSLIDEPFGALDRENREDLARKFSSMLGKVGIGQAFIVSHDEALLDSLPSRILISRHSKHSTIEVVQ